MTFRSLRIDAVLPVLAIVMRIASTPMANASYLVIASYALLGCAQAIQALALSWLFGMLNSGIVVAAEFSTVGRYVVLGAAVVSVFSRSGGLLSNMRIKRPIFLTALLGLFLIFHSLLFSSVKDVSELKALSWLLAASTLISAWDGLSNQFRAALVNHIFIGIVIVMVTSLPLLMLPSGFLTNGTGFQGILSQPQAFGAIMGLLGAWAFSRALEQQRPPWGLLLVAGISLVLVVLSEARTGGMAMILGLGTAVVTISVVRGQGIRLASPGLTSGRVHFLTFFALVTVIFAGPFLTDRIGSFVIKRSAAGQSSGLWSNLVYADEIKRRPGWVVQSLLR